MRLVSWNANGRFRDKIELFSARQFDVLVIQECENTEASRLAYEHAGWRLTWLGANPHKGLGVFVRPSARVESLDWPIVDCEYFLPVKINQQIIVGVWAMGGKSAKHSYAGQVRRFLRACSGQLNASSGSAREAPIILGDFNSNVIWDKRHSEANHSNNNQTLETLGFTSLYHAKKQQQQGNEKDPTFYLYRHADKPYHLDYIYVPSGQLADSSVKVGRRHKWLRYSDHMPVFAETATLDAGV